MLVIDFFLAWFKMHIIDKLRSKTLRSLMYTCKKIITNPSRNSIPNPDRCTENLLPKHVNFFWTCEYQRPQTSAMQSMEHDKEENE